MTYRVTGKTVHNYGRMAKEIRFKMPFWDKGVLKRVAGLDIAGDSELGKLFHQGRASDYEKVDKAVL